MENENSSNPIPDGWEFKTEHQKDGSKTSVIESEFFF